ncbi:MAG: signal peptidase I [Patescibacteria group bacterium]|jgi:signal peptidase I|nr:signal peptidase I [Patescibacteria group bacterium]
MSQFFDKIFRRRQQMYLLPPRRIQTGLKIFVWELVKIVVISLAIIIPVRYFLIQPFYVKGASMEPTLYDHEYLIIDEISYRVGEVSRGDVIVFKYPKDPTQYFIKRVIGLPGETVIIKDGEVFIKKSTTANEIKLDETDYLAPGTQTRGDIKIELSEKEYYVLGDNRNYSLDSRVFGIVPKDLIIGRSWLRGWPVDRLESFKSPIYNIISQ